MTQLFRVENYVVFLIPLQTEDYSHYSNKRQHATTPIPTRTLLESLVGMKTVGNSPGKPSNHLILYFLHGNRIGNAGRENRNGEFGIFGTKQCGLIHVGNGWEWVN